MIPSFDGIRTVSFLAAISTLTFIGSADPAAAYIGPGAGLSAIGTAIALILAVALAFVGFVWYPIKRLMRKRRASAQQADGETDSAP